MQESNNLNINVLLTTIFNNGKIKNVGQVWWCTSVIPATQEEKDRGPRLAKVRDPI
jgi:hypothetical protein